jgi:hypothetical protein
MDVCVCVCVCVTTYMRAHTQTNTHGVLDLLVEHRGQICLMKLLLLLLLLLLRRRRRGRPAGQELRLDLSHGQDAAARRRRVAGPWRAERRQAERVGGAGRRHADVTAGPP